MNEISLLKEIHENLKNINIKYEKIEDIGKHLDKIEWQIERLVEKLDQTIKSTYENSKDIEHIKEDFRKSNVFFQKEIDTVWSDGVRKLEGQFISCRDSKNDLKKDIERNVMKSVRVILYGSGIMALVSFIGFIMSFIKSLLEV